MRDLDIWRRLGGGTATTADLAALAALPLGRRCAFVGGALALTTHADADMRAAALRVLAGARGIEALRAIVAALDDDDASVRVAAVDALREVARDAPTRFAHALFHPRDDVRRDALGRELSEPLAQLAIYLRSDRACHDLAATRGHWPDGSLALACSFFSNGHIRADELLEACRRNGSEALRTYLLAAHRRDPDAVSTYIDRASHGRVAAGGPPGADTIDWIIRALAQCPPGRRELGRLVDAVIERKSLQRRTVAALLGQLATTPDDGELWGLVIALEPRLLAMPDLPVEHVDAIIDALTVHRHVPRPGDDVVQRLLALPVVQRDLALAAALAARAGTRRLALLAEVRGEDVIIDELVARDRGWLDICRIAPETPALDISWLAKVEKRDYKRYVALAGIALTTFYSERQVAFVEQMPRRHRPAVFTAALLGLATAGADDVRFRALGKVLGPRIDRITLVAMMPALLDGDPSGRAAVAIARSVADSILASAAADVTVAHAIRLVALIEADPIPRDRELALAKAFSMRGIAALAEWCTRVQAVLTSPVASASPPIVRARRELTVREERAIQTAKGRALDTALVPALGGWVSGLVRALDMATGRVPHVWACVALLGCADPIEDIARVLDTYSEPTETFDTAVDNAMAGFGHVRDLPPLAQARLWRWETHQFAFLDWLDANGGLLGVLQFAERLRYRFARATLWQAVSQGVMLARYRVPARYLEQMTLELALYCADRIDQPIGRHAARIVVALVECGAISVSAVRDRVLDRIADADGETRSFAARLVRLEGMPEVQATAPPPPVNVVDDIRRSRDLDALAGWCSDTRASVVQEAALALVALGPDGQRRLADVLAARTVPMPVPILATIVLWDHAPALDAIRSLADDARLDASWHFHLALALLYRGEPDALPRALAAVRAPSERWYFRRADWDALTATADLVTCSIALADAPHHHAYQRAVKTLLSLTRPTEAVHGALVRFLEVDGERPLHLRMSAARYIARHFGDTCGLPLMIEEVCDANNRESHAVSADLPDRAFDPLARAVTDAALIGGNPVCGEGRMWWLLENFGHTASVSPEVLSELRLRVFASSTHAATRRQAAQRVLTEGKAHARVRRVAEVFAWGVRRGIELAGRMFTFHMTSKEADLGHTRLDTNKIFVSALPMLRDEPHGRDIVEGLVLHEIGHHVYHRSERALALWKRAHAEGIGHFLNLIADEHLERNLRATDPDYGDRLKRLGAYAFQHAPQEMKVASLCHALGAATASALIPATLDVAYDEDCVRLRRGAVLAELDRLGHPVARFSRALRMGLGNRAGDPLNATALALCGKDLRSLDMQGLYDLTRKLVDLFGGQVEIAKCFGGPEGLTFGERDDDVYGAGIDDDILQREIERILEPGRRTGSPRGGGGRLQINVNPSTEFPTITKITKVQGDKAAHRELASSVARHSSRLRGYLDDLGLRWEPARARTQGRALDRTRLRALVTRNDPRILVARTPQRKTDLFIGTLVDCSGSMQARNNIHRAKRFAVLVAEAVRELPGVEARFFGFTDSEIFDAGTKHDCHVNALKSQGGNNDAGALYHAANIAIAAPHRAKVLIMISDGLPTECSVAALKNLVTELTRKRGIVCAQAAVIDITEVCFPHYVLIDDDQLEIAVAKFGRMIADLARRSLAS